MNMCTVKADTLYMYRPYLEGVALKLATIVSVAMILYGNSGSSNDSNLKYEKLSTLLW